MLRRATLLTGAVALFAAVPVAMMDSAGAANYSKRLRTAISELPVQGEVRTGYDRSKFQHWIDADHDGCDTREEVLIAEAKVAPHVGAGCSISGGKWYSYYDEKYWTTASRIDIDHVVALAEAWDSGARSWTATQRKAYANDLGDGRTLVGVTDTVNAAKGDKDPTAWLPPKAAERCHYIGSWVAVKIRWKLKVDQAEKNKLRSLANACPNVTITVARATALSPPVTSPPTTHAPTCSSSYPTVCIPPPPPDLDCGDIPYRNFPVVGTDPHGFDGDKDGVGCET